MTLDPNYHPSLQTTLPLTIIYQHYACSGWSPYLLVAESALLSKARAPPALGVYALTRFRGPRGDDGLGDAIGHYGGAIVASAPKREEAEVAAQGLVRQGRSYLLTMRLQGHRGWHVVDGEMQAVMPYLHRVNDPRGTQLLPRCTVSEFGLFRAARDIPSLDWTRPLREQASSELSFDYGVRYWEIHDRLGSSPDMPLEVESSAALLRALRI